MKKPSMFSKAWSAILCCVLVAATALTLAACSGNETPTTPTDEGTSAVVSTASETKPTPIDGNQIDASAVSDGGETNITELGEGKTTFDLLVTDRDGNKKQFAIHTDETTVGAALLALGLIEGDEGQYGLYVKTVDGITADYDKDKTYWAFYVNGEYATAGVDQTNIDEGAVYSFVISK